jgi:thiamine-phosphate pyrophosphorylase
VTQAPHTKAPQSVPPHAAPLGRLHVIVNVEAGGAGVQPAVQPLRLAQQALEGGAPVIQLRAKSTADRQLFDLALRMAALCDDYRATLIVDDCVDIAVASGAHGVHVGADDLPVAATRELLGPARVLGATCRNPEAAAAAERTGATYIGAGPCYPTSTKTGLPEPIGLTTLSNIAAAVALPVIAIAGVTAERVPELLESGAYGVAVVGAVASAEDPVAATRQLVDIIEDCL